MVSRAAVVAVVASCFIACVRPGPRTDSGRNSDDDTGGARTATDAGVGHATMANDAGRPTAASLPTEPPLCAKADCPVAPMYPTEHCADGRHLGMRGPCVRLEGGGCAWTRLVCPEKAAAPACESADCGPAPAYTVWSCAGGNETGAFETCARQAPGGRCGWVYRTCPFVPRPAAAAPDAGPPAPVAAAPKTCDPLPSDKQLKTWDIGSVCQSGGGPAQPPRERVHDLGDGTYIFKGRRGCFRARYRKCRTKCLAPDTMIATPAGDVRIDELEIGAPVWTRDVDGTRVAGVVLETAAERVRDAHHVAQLELADGRAVTVSLQHPLLGGWRVQDVRTGEAYDGSEVVGLRVFEYTRSHTHDILPSGETGGYWANGIPMRSTLSTSR